jgi:hypothetical protein
MVLSNDIFVNSRENVSAYLKVIQRIGKVKGYSPMNDNTINDDIGFCLEGNSNGIEFMLYDIESLLRDQLDEADHGRKQLKFMTKKTEGILRAEVRLTESKTIHAYTDESTASEQLMALLDKRKEIFLENFIRVIPFGDFYKKETAVEIIKKDVSDLRLRRRMIRLLELIPEKKSLLLAQKALNYREIDHIMDKFAEIYLSPITVSKRHDIKYLENLYSFIL